MEQRQFNGTEIAIVGMAARLPGARDVDSYWDNLRQGIESIRQFSDEELRAARVSEALLHDPNYVKVGAWLDDVDMFDAALFGFSPREAAIMDPQHRHFLEVAWEALEHAGYDPARFDGSIGVYGGSGHNAYMPYNLLTNPQLMDDMGLFLVRHTGNDKDFLTTRVSYLLNLTGPSVNVQTACSTALVAIHMAGQALIDGECDMALAGGVTIEMPPQQGYLYREDEILSPDGHCRSFDAASKGTVFGSGAGIVVLKRLEDALDDGDTIHAVIIGSAVNNDGSGKVNYFAPSVDGQAAAIAEALGVADIDPETVSYIEAHGTGTQLGDPIEIAALTQAFSTSKRNYCALGSVKSNIGHLDTAAGVAGLIKVVQALKHQQLPPSLHFETPNPAIDFDRSPFYVNACLKPWTAETLPRRAGVSSLGVGGTNAHVLVEEAPQLETGSDSRSWQVLMLSARTQTALDRATENLAAHIKKNPHSSLADTAYTLQVGRQNLPLRRIVAVRDAEDAADALVTMDRKRVFAGKADGQAAGTVFMFPGGGAQYANMGRDLYEEEPVFRAAVDECLSLLSEYLPLDLKSLMFPCPDADLEAVNAQLEQTTAALPALFTMEYALAQLWLSWGIKPAAMIGHSMGEYTAACLAGVFSLADALRLVTLRGELFATLPAGAMLSVPSSEDMLPGLLNDKLSVAAVNAPELCVVSGEVAAIEALEADLKIKGVEARRLHIAVAAHSAMLEPILDRFLEGARQITFNSPTMPYVSNVTGDWIKAEEATDPAYWVKHLRQTVQFAAGVRTVLDQDSNYLLLEVGPGTGLSSLARMQGGGLVALASLRHPRDEVSDLQYILTSLGRLWIHGQTIDWDAYYAQETRRRIPLPTYPFDHQRYWIEPGQAVYDSRESLAKQSNIENWFYRPVWEPRPLDTQSDTSPQRWLIFMDDFGWGKRIIRHLQDAGHEVMTVQRGPIPQTLKGGRYVINHTDPDDYFGLLDELVATDSLPHRVIYLWGVMGQRNTQVRLDFLDRIYPDVFYAPLLFAQALGSHVLPHPLHWFVVTDGMNDVLGEGLRYPEQTLLMGPNRVIPNELPGVTCQNIDLRDADWRTQVPALMQELYAACDDPVVAYREGRRWVQSFHPSRPEKGETRLREGGVYLITGGLGGIGAVVAEHLASSVRARLVLLARRSLPDESEWDHWLSTHNAGHETSRRIKLVKSLRAMGTEVLVLAADVADQSQVAAAIRQARDQFGHIDGLFHAAGVISDGLIMEKTRTMADRVLLPKVRGTIVLSQALEDDPPDFMMLFSSTSSVLGIAGQVDYAAANAFLDSFAYFERSRGKTYTVAVNWGAWQNIGMASLRDNHSVEEYDPDAGEDSGHPLLGRRVLARATRSVFIADYDETQLWLLDEHRLSNGRALLPGTGYLEIMRAALTVVNGNQGTILIEDMVFMSPLDVTGSQRVRITVEDGGEAFRITVASLRGDQWVDHAVGKVSHSDMPQPAPILLDKIRQRCPYERQPGTNQERHLRFGPRWNNIKKVYQGVNEALAALELPQAYQDELPTYALHPALLDIATGFPLPLIADYDTRDDFYVPLSYKRLRQYRPLPARIWSHARHQTLENASDEIAYFDVTLFDLHGNVLAQIDEFTVRRFNDVGRLLSDTPAVENVDSTETSKSSRILELAQRGGISAEDGKAVLNYVLSGKFGPQVLASSFYLPDLRAFIAEDQAPGDDKSVLLSRPELSDEYIAPRNPIEEKLASLWSSLLGVEQVGVDDDFFELGGHSLIAVRLFAQIRKEFAVEFNLATLFEAGTVAELSQRLLDAGVSLEADAANSPAHQLRRRQVTRISNYSNLVAVKPDGSKPPFFVVHGAGGNVVVYKPIANRLDPEQPLYALQARGVDGRAIPLTRIEDMAALYLREVRAVQPQGPYYLGGFSMGGEVAFEMAQQLLQAGEKVALLVLFDTYNPDRPIRQDNPMQQKLQGHAQRLAGLTLSQRMAYTYQWIKTRFSRLYLRTGFRLAGLVGFKLPYTFVESSLWEANLKAIHNYAPQPYPGRILLFRASESLPKNPLDHPMSWGPLAAEGVEQHIVNGTHRIVDEPYVIELVAKLQSELDAAQAGLSTPV